MNIIGLHPALPQILNNGLQHFELTSESALRAAQAQVRAEIQPEVERLLDRVGNYLDRLERKEKGLTARAELLEGRVGNDNRVEEGDRQETRSRGARSRGEKESDEKEERLRQLRQKKERLAYAVERLSLQAQQREKQLRKSMAAQ